LENILGHTTGLRPNAGLVLVRNLLRKPILIVPLRYVPGVLFGKRSQNSEGIGATAKHVKKPKDGLIDTPIKRKRRRGQKRIENV
jgi:hypothetical protein